MSRSDGWVPLRRRTGPAVLVPGLYPLDPQTYVEAGLQSRLVELDAGEPDPS